MTGRQMRIIPLLLAATLFAGCPAPPQGQAVAPDTATAIAAAPAPPATQARLPRLVDFGRGACVPCKMMAPVLEQLRTEYAGRVSVEYIDITENPAAARAYGVRTIPTQIFFDAGGNEVSRHEGFYPKEDIIAVFQQMGVR